MDAQIDPLEPQARRHRLHQLQPASQPVGVAAATAKLEYQSRREPKASNLHIIRLHPEALMEVILCKMDQVSAS